MNVAEWASLAATVFGFLVTIATTQFSQAKTRGEFRSLLRNFPLHKHIKINLPNGTVAERIEYPAEYPKPADPNGSHYPTT